MNESLVVVSTADRIQSLRSSTLMEGLVQLGVRVIQRRSAHESNSVDRLNSVGSARGWFQQLTGWGRSFSSAWGAAGEGRKVDRFLVPYFGEFDAIALRMLRPRSEIYLDLLVTVRDTLLDRRVTSKLTLAAAGLLDFVACWSASILLIDTEENRTIVPRLFRKKAVVVPVGAPESCFERQDRQVSQDGANTRVIYFGHFTPLHGCEVIAEAINSLADQPISFTMIGAGQDYEITRQSVTNPNVDWISESLEFEELFDLASKHHVCLGVFGGTAKTLRVVPHKVYQGAALGLATITGDAPPVRERFGDALVYVPQTDPVALARALRKISQPRELEKYRDRARQRAESFRPTSIVKNLLNDLANRDRLPERCAKTGSLTVSKSAKSGH